MGKWDLGMHKWKYTPTFRGFDTFYGYYNAAEDYYTHRVGIKPSIDFRNDTEPVTDKDGFYSTNLFTEAVQEAIEKYDSDKGPFFIYTAYISLCMHHWKLHRNISTSVNQFEFLMKTVANFVEC